MAVACIAAVLIGGAPVRADAPSVQWPDLLPAVPTSANPQPGPQPGCAVATLACLDYEIARMRDAQTRFACDHRAIFATTYLVLTETLRDTLRRQPDYFADRSFLLYEDALFAHYYFRTLDDQAAGRAVPEAWRIAFATAASGDANGAQDMLLGINAHVQRDMPYVLATLGLHFPNGTTRKFDHDRFNEILNHAYVAVVGAIARRYDPLVGVSNPGTPVDNAAGLELVKGWREGVWRNAERLLNAPTPADRAAVESSIEATAAASARLISLVGVPPGYRAQRDAFCAAHLGAAPPTTSSPARHPRPRAHPHRHRHAHRHRRGHRQHAHHRHHRRGHPHRHHSRP